MIRIFALCKLHNQSKKISRSVSEKLVNMVASIHDELALREKGCKKKNKRKIEVPKQNLPHNSVNEEHSFLSSIRKRRRPR